MNNMSPAGEEFKHKTDAELFAEPHPVYELIGDFPGNKDFQKDTLILFQRWNKYYWVYKVKDCQGEREYLMEFFDRYPHIFKKINPQPIPPPHRQV